MRGSCVCGGCSVGVCADGVLGDGVFCTRCRGGFDCCANREAEISTTKIIKALRIQDLAYIASVRKLGIVTARMDGVPFRRRMRAVTCKSETIDEIWSVPSLHIHSLTGNASDPIDSSIRYRERY